MTLHNKPVVKRSHRPSWESHHRHSLYLNIGFGLAALIGVLALIGAGAATYAGDHFAEVASVNGTKITKDQVRDRVKIDAFRIQQAESLVRTEVQLGRMTSAQGDSRISSYEQQQQSLSRSIVSRLIDVTLQGQLAAAQGIQIADPQIDQQLVKEATHAEQRHILEISVVPAVTAPATLATDAQKTAAKAKAEQALADLKAGKPFEQVAKAVSADSFTASGGDAGWVFADDSTFDKGFLAAVFALPQGGLTDVLAGADGTFRIGKVAEIAPQTVDANWTRLIQDHGIAMNVYRDAVRGDLVREALSAKVVADATTQPTTQRQVSEIFISSANYKGPGDEVKVRHILYTPGNKPPSQTPIASNDPGWATARAEAQATYDKLKALAANPAELDKAFQAIARKDSLDTGSGANGGDLPYLTAGQLDRGFADAIFKPGLKKGDLIGPVQSQFGWHVILFEDRRLPPEARANGLAVQASAAGADFAALARQNSDGPEAAKGGDLGWVAHYQLDPTIEAAIFAAPVGKLSAMLQAKDGFYLFLVQAEQMRTPDGAQLDTIKSTAFTYWYAAQKAKAVIKQTGTAPTVTTPTGIAAP